MIDVDHDAGEHGPVAGGALHLAVQPLVQRPPVEQAGERIGLGELAHRALAVPGFFVVLGFLDRGRRRFHHPRGETQIGIAQGRIARAGAEEEHPGPLTPERKGQHQ